MNCYICLNVHKKVCKQKNNVMFNEHSIAIYCVWIEKVHVLMQQNDMHAVDMHAGQLLL